MLSPQKLKAIQQVKKEYLDIYNNPILNIGAQVGLPDPTNIMEWKCTMTGPQDTPYRQAGQRQPVQTFRRLPPEP